MWEQIRSNRRKTAGLVVVMAAILAVLGFVIAESYMQGGGFIGLAVAGGIWMLMSLVAFFGGDRILLGVSGAKKIDKADHPELFNVVEEMTIASGLSKMPDIYIIDDMSMNAFAVGRKKEKAAVAVTAGLLGRLNRDELQGVVAHEIAHIVNRDVLLMSMVGVMLGAIVMISEIYLRSLFYGSVRGARYRSRSRSKGGEQAVLAIVALVLAILAPILAQLIYFAISRRREYLADASGAVYTRYPEGLASALEQLGGSREPVRRANKATAPMYIVNPFKKAKLRGLASTHPPIEKRVEILRNFGSAATYAEYQKAWERSEGKKAGHLPKSALADTEHGGTVREPSAPPGRKSPRKQLREVGDLMRDIHQFIFLPCVCGVKLKIPPEYQHDSIRCPRCKRDHRVPIAELAAAQTLADNILKAKPATPTRETLRIRRTPGEWMTFKCGCGKTKTLSPGFAGDRLTCKACGRTIEIVD